MNLKLGAHLSTAAGYESAIESLIEKGGTALQIFSTSPRIWKPAKVSEDTAHSFVSELQRTGVGPVFFHASYLINLADSERIGAVSRQSLIAELTLQPRMHVMGSVIHLGSYKDKNASMSGLFPPEKYSTLIRNIKEVLAETPPESRFIIENVATRKIGQSLEELTSIINDVGSDRIDVCLDTCHLHAAGFDLSTEESFTRFFERFESLIGIRRIALFHLNDSRDDFGSMRDRHANLGEGSIPKNVFVQLLNNPQTRTIPFILEVPGFEDTGPDKRNLDIAKSFIIEG